MNKWIIALIILIFVFAANSPAFAHDETMCESTTIDSLSHCLAHALEMGHISNLGVYDSLQAKVRAAQAAATRNQNSTAINVLRAFIQEVQAQAGIHIEAEHAQHIETHAQHIIDALSH